MREVGSKPEPEPKPSPKPKPKPKPKPNQVREEGCVLRRGMLIIIDQGPDFLIGLAHHPEWSPSYTHVADVVAEDLVVVDTIMGSNP